MHGLLCGESCNDAKRKVLNFKLLSSVDVGNISIYQKYRDVSKKSISLSSFDDTIRYDISISKSDTGISIVRYIVSSLASHAN